MTASKKAPQSPNSVAMGTGSPAGGHASHEAYTVRRIGLSQCPSVTVFCERDTQIRVHALTFGGLDAVTYRT
eukprot:15361205-Ditylum_brightwellii.AAC.1